MMHILGMILIGLIAGSLAKLLMRHWLHLKNEEPASIAGSIDMRIEALGLLVD